MIAKLCAFAPTATSHPAVARGAGWILRFRGTPQTSPFSARSRTASGFRRGALSTDFIAQEFPHGFAPPAGFTDADRVILVAAALAERRLAASHGTAQLCVLIDGKPHDVTVRPENGGYAIESGGETRIAATDWRPSDRLLRFRTENGVATVQIERLPGNAFRLTHAGVVRRVQVLPPRAATLLQMIPPKIAADTSRSVLSPMPGLLSALVVEEGQEVKAGEALAIVEAMKMENVLRAERDGTIAKLCAKPGDSLAVDQVILEFA